MTPIFKSLERISTGYTVFEKDQVLTHEQLNSLADYADDQSRLTRAKLLGVGIACGLHVFFADARVKVTRGVGVTTDGDLMYLDADTIFTRFKPYDESYPAYPPFYENEDLDKGKMIRAFELLPDDTDDDRSEPLGTLVAMGYPLDRMAAVLLMESYRSDDDICSGTDCDNLGNQAINTIKVILIDGNSAPGFLENIPTGTTAFKGLLEIVADRPMVSPALNSPAAIGSLYRSSCAKIHNVLIQRLAEIYPVCSAILGNTFASDPAPAWIAQLENLRSIFGSRDANIQYYYDFLKDLVETYNDFRGLLFGDRTWCSPSVSAFPKHLLLGRLLESDKDSFNATVPLELIRETIKREDELANPGAADPGPILWDANRGRTRFYPSPAVGCSASDLDHARFLIRKIDTLIANVAISAESEIRITPSSFEDIKLEERAIPFYYRIDAGNPVHYYWNYRLTERGMEAYNYSYRAELYGAQGGAGNPFGSQVGRFSFFRIEGHLGKPVASVLSTIKTLIRTYNLPIAVQAIMAGVDRTRITVKPLIRYNDLHRLHYVLRQDLSSQMDDVIRFSGTFKAKIDEGVAKDIARPEDCDCPSIRDLAATANADLLNLTGTAKQKLNQSYVSYARDTLWQEAVKNTMANAGQFKANLGAVVKNEFATPFDTLISSTHVSWLPWLDEVIKQKDEKEDAKLLLSRFIELNPGAEHFAGVLRGGTFILVYDANNNVIADFMLPYYLPTVVEEEVVEPPLIKPAIKPDYVVDNGIKVQPSRNTFIKTKLEAATGQIRAEVYGSVDTKIYEQNQKIEAQNQKLNFQNEYMGLFRESVGMLGSTVPRADQLASRSSNDSASAISDEYLAIYVAENKVLASKIELLRKKADQTTDQRLRYQYLSEAAMSEPDLATGVAAIFRYIAAMKLSMAAGSDAPQAVTAVRSSLKRLLDEEVKNQFREAMNDIAKMSENPLLRDLIYAVLAELG